MPGIAVDGHSGCDVQVQQGADGVVVIKSAVEPAYSTRLRAQIRKQREAHASNVLPFVRIPQILDEGSIDGCYRATMEYVYFQDPISFFARSSTTENDRVSQMLLSYISSQLDISHIKRFSVAPLQEKLDDVARSLQRGQHFESYRPSIAAINRDLARRRDLVIPIGPCHGDLTFSNVMIASDSSALAVFDFLDGFLESPLVDIAKLRQDSRFGWTSLMASQPFDRVRFFQIMRFFDARVTLEFSTHDWYDENIEMLMGLNLLRIAPYAKRPDVHEFIVKALRQLRM